MSHPPSDNSVNDEPQFSKAHYQGDPSERRVDGILDEHPTPRQAEDQRAENTVWDEPGLSSDLAGKPPPDAETYHAWLERRYSETTANTAWLVTLCVALCSGLWAILGAFFSGRGSAIWLLAVTVIGPTAEEIMKSAAALYVVEKRPFLFRSRLQVYLCVAVSALTFAAVENMLYLHVYTSDPSETMIVWRWTVCVALHTGCSLVAAMGLARMWKDTWDRHAKPKTALAYPYIVLAVLIHGTYNGFVVLIATVGFTF